MRVYVADLGGRADPHVIESVDQPGLSKLETVLYVPVARRISREKLESQLDAMHSQWLRVSQLVVLRIHSPQAAELLNEERAAEDLDKLLEGLPVLIAHLGSDLSIELTPLGAAPPESYVGEELIEALRSAELESWLERPGVVFPANEDFHYEGPNGCRYESFMRIGTAIQGGEMLDAVAFWLQPYLGGSPLVVLDAWTIMSVALNLNRYAAQSGAPCQSVAEVECLGAYDEEREKLKDRLVTARKTLSGDPPPALLISSVVSTGTLHEQLEELVIEADFGKPDSLALYGDANSAGTVFCRPRQIGRYWRPDEECPLPTPTVSIARETYMVEVSVRPERQTIDKSHAKKAWGFFKDYGGTDVLSVHRDEPRHPEVHLNRDEPRHHMIHLDVAQLAKQPPFAERLGSVLAGLPEVDVILAPHVPAAVDLAERASDGLDVDLVIANEKELPGLPSGKRAKLEKASRILLVEDVVISGTGLLGYRNYLRRGGYVSADNPPEIHLLAGVERVDDNAKLRGITDMVHGGTQFHPVESLLLPDWGETECPWCWEQRQLKELGDEPLSEGMEKRKRDLLDREKGLTDSLFVPWVRETEDPLPVPVWDLGPDSIFHVESQVELFTAVASAVQSLRAGENLMEQPRYPLAKVLDPSCWLSGRYYDPVIAAAILRATRRHDLRATDVEEELLEGVAERSQAQEDVLGELIMAAARGHLPLGPEMGPEGKVLSDPRADKGFVALMRHALRGPDYSTT